MKRRFTVKRIVILGSTGSIGRQALEVVDEHPDKYEITGLAAGSNVELLAEQINKYRPGYVAVKEEEGARKLRQLLKGNNKTEISYGRAGLLDLAGLDGIDLVLVAVTGIAGLEPTLAALNKGTQVALANKESLVAGGQLVMGKAQEAGIRILPVDSEHSAIFQCLEEENRACLDKLILTASGGPFWDFSLEEMGKVTPQMALKHPRWQMGPKVTIDSAGLINKGLEIIEAHWLFDVPYEQIQVLIHPQTIIHSLVQYADGAVIAQLGLPDMRIPIQYAMSYPKRLPNSFPKLDLFHFNELSLFEPDWERFPGLKLAFAAGKTGGTMPVVYNAANEAAVELFLEGRIGFLTIPEIIEKAMQRHVPNYKPDLDIILASDQWARETVKQICLT